MKKIDQGEFKIFTTKKDAVDKFRQMQGVCRENISNEKLIQFYCDKKGEICILHPPTRRTSDCNSTNLFAKVIERDGKTFVSYYTGFSESIHVMNIIIIVIYMIMVVLGIICAIASANSIYYLLLLILSLVLFGIRLIGSTKEKANSPTDSKILVEELKNRVEAINMWDK